jgi:hypothetical protein
LVRLPAAGWNTDGMLDRYGHDVLATRGRPTSSTRAQHVVAEPDLVVEDVDTGWCGAVVGVEKAGGMHVVHLEDRRGRRRGFPLGPGFLVDGRPVVLTAPVSEGAQQLARSRAQASRTASGSTAVADAPARVAAASRIFVEGRHDAELLEKVWGADLRLEGIVVETLDGVDDLRAAIRAFGPTPQRRMGVLVDHLVPGTKEDRVVQDARREPGAAWVRILGHPYVDVWQSVRPERIGLSQWPVIRPGRPWKHAVLAELGWPCQNQRDVAVGWRRILASVRTYHDLEPRLLASVEELIDFVTVPPTESSAS